jgi:hypothetical protein
MYMTRAAARVGDLVFVNIAKVIANPKPTFLGANHSWPLDANF